MNSPWESNDYLVSKVARYVKDRRKYYIPIQKLNGRSRMMGSAEDFEIYNEGICYASVCTVLSIKDAEDMLNMLKPVSGQWRKSKDRTFRTGQPNPCDCEQHPGTHKHILFSC